MGVCKYVTMAQVLYPTNTSIEGPLLIEKNSLAQLDSILNEHWKRLVENQEAAFKKELDLKMAERATVFTTEQSDKLRSAIESELRGYLRYEQLRDLTIYFADGRKLRVESFSEAISHVEIIDELPVAFQLDFKCGNVSLSIETQDFSESRLRVSASSPGNKAAQDLYGDVKNWLRNIKPSKWLAVWGKVADLSFLVWMAWFFGLWVISAISFTNSVDYKSVGRQIVEKGITPENRDQALQAILAIQSEYGSMAFHPNVAFWIFVLGGFLACLILSYAPKIVIGLGKGEQRISSWKAWIKFVFAYIPLFVASNIVAPILVEFLSRKMKP